MSVEENQTLDKVQAFSSLVNETQASVRAFVRSIGVASDAVDDIAQEAFLIAFKKFHEFDDSKASFRTWVFGIAKNLFMNDKRKEARRSRLQNQMIGDMLLKLEAPFKDHRQDEIKTLKSCIESMDDDNRDLLKNRYVNNKKSHELAEETGQKPAAVRQKLLRLRAILKKCMGEKLS